MGSRQRPGGRAVLAHGAYRRLLAAQTISRWGDTASTLALVVLVFQLTGSGLRVSGVIVAEILPVLLLAPIAGAVADRLPRIRVMVAAGVCRMVFAALLPLAGQHLAAVYAIAFGLSAGAVFFNPASASALRHRRRNELVAATSALLGAIGAGAATGRCCSPG